MTYYAFDLLHLNGDRHAQACRWASAKLQLTALLGRDSETGQLRVSESLDESGPVLHKHACRIGP